MSYSNHPLAVRFRSLFRALLLALLAGLPLAGFAASLRLVPLSIVLDSEPRRGTLTITNAGDEKITVQIQMMKWTQDGDGKDVYEPTKDLVFFPQIVAIDTGKEAIVRVGCQTDGALSVEKAYRLFLQELPVSKPGAGVIKTLLRVSMPVFITARSPLRLLSLEDTWIADGKIQVRIRNKGTNHSMIKKIAFAGLDEGGAQVFLKELNGWYMLPGASRVFPIAIARQECTRVTSIKITATSEDGTLEGNLALDDQTRSQLPESGT